MKTKGKIKLPECLCGCGGRTKGARFLPGHDAKLKKALVADARAGKKRAANRWRSWLKFSNKGSDPSEARPSDAKRDELWVGATCLCRWGEGTPRLLSASTSRAGP
jgi:hypothetical protein